MRHFVFGILIAATVFACSDGGSGPNGHQHNNGARVAHIGLTPVAPTVMAVGDTVRMAATPQDSLFVPVANVNITWQSLNTAVLSVAALTPGGGSGRVDAVGAGSALLRLSAGNISVDFTINVTP